MADWGGSGAEAQTERELPQENAEHAENESEASGRKSRAQDKRLHLPALRIDH
jgi:hypothetical protein